MPKQDEQETVDQEKLAEEAAFEAAMNDDNDDVTTPLESEQETAGGDAATEEGTPTVSETEEVEQERVEVIPGYTKEELNAALTAIPQLRKAIDTQNGTYGHKFQEQNRVIAELQAKLEKRAETTPAPAATAKVTSDSLKKLREAGFDELAEALAEDLSGLIPSNANGLNVEELTKGITEQFAGRLDEFAKVDFERGMKRLNKTHSDWQDIATFKTTETGAVIFNNPEFGNWFTQQPVEVQREVIDSKDPWNVLDIISDYKEALGNKEIGAPDALKPKTNSALRKAVTPKGATASRQLSDKQAEEEAFRREMAGEY